MFEVDPLVKPAVIEKFKDELETKYQGVVNAGKSLILYPGMKAFLSGFSSVDLQLIEMVALVYRGHGPRLVDADISPSAFHEDQEWMDRREFGGTMDQFCSL